VSLDAAAGLKDHEAYQLSPMACPAKQGNKQAGRQALHDDWMLEGKGGGGRTQAGEENKTGEARRK